MNEHVLVEAHLRRRGLLRPRAFVWRDRRYAVASIGRQWTDGGETHVLVMAEGGGTFELALQQDSGAWQLVRAPEDFGARPRV